MNVRTLPRPINYWQVFARPDGRTLGWCETLQEAARDMRDARLAGVLADVKRVTMQAHPK